MKKCLLDRVRYCYKHSQCLGKSYNMLEIKQAHSRILKGIIHDRKIFTYSRTQPSQVASSLPILVSLLQHQPYSLLTKILSCLEAIHINNFLSLLSLSTRSNLCPHTLTHTPTHICMHSHTGGGSIHSGLYIQHVTNSLEFSYQDEANPLPQAYWLQVMDILIL